MKVAMFRRHWLDVLLIILVILAYFLPGVLYLMDRSGIKLDDPRKVIGVEIEIGEGWFPLYSSSTAIGRLIISPTNPKTVVFCKIDWINPWSCERVWVYRNAISTDAAKSRELFSSIKQYAWGSVGIVRDDVTQTPGRKLALILGYGVAISAQNLDILQDIKKVERASGLPENKIKK